ncbi:hypothetical protein A374_19360 [Fictibacillus macauensis ZFHKF-1]|uniref:N-acetyltransferase domain-containing protein n=1 Tax=Fictibacillus macauensis ZFHKF-1 TaxID=1196324 RepID=I8U9S7_9BACL|nr:GNAT family N-acetyltransferase [Fictibacillus macauensis]EIT83710.1 hypothetical protein A374_19360 [Fictibacillus macauensis ZFHKF-1]
MTIIIHRQLTPKRQSQLLALYESVGWTRHTEDIIAQLYAASDLYAFATVEDTLVGCIRCLTDGVFNAALYDVIVHPSYQRQGVARLLVHDLLERLTHISCIHLLATTGNEAFYEKLGFKKTKTGMARYSNPALAFEYLV